MVASHLPIRWTSTMHPSAMPPIVSKLLIAGVAFLLPIGSVCFMQREQLRPYVIADADRDRPGKILYFARRG